MNKPIEESLNPWFSIWTKPRATIRQIMATDPERNVFLLVALAGITQVLDKASTRCLGDELHYSAIIAIAVLMGPISGIIGVLISSELLRWTGKWIGGKGTRDTIRSAIAWASIPIIFRLLLWVAEIAIFRQEVFTSEMPISDSSYTLLVFLMVFGLLEIIIAIWTIIIFLKCLGEVQSFSAWKALWNSILSGLVIFIPVLSVVLVFMGLMSLFT